MPPRPALALAKVFHSGRRIPASPPKAGFFNVHFFPGRLNHRLISDPESFTIERAQDSFLCLMSTPSRFIADTMLGKLARWLRILGYDTLYFRDIEDPTLIQIAFSQRRWLLTRDAILLKERRPINYTFVRSDHPRNQLIQVVTELDLSVDRFFLRRCPECNDELITLPKNEAQPLVPEYVYQTQQQFSRCPACRRVYWSGTHYHRICERLNELFPKHLQR